LTSDSSKASVCKLFKDVFNVSQDEDFIYHESAQRLEVKDYEKGDGNGPSSDDLHFDMNNSSTSPWNAAVFEILGKKLKAQREAQPVHLQPPERSEAYIKRMLMEKFKQCRHHWKLAQPKIAATSLRETAEEVGKRIDEKKDHDLEHQRHNMQRLSISV